MHYSDVKKCSTDITISYFIQGGIVLGVKFYQERALLENGNLLVKKKYCAEKAILHILSQIPALKTKGQVKGIFATFAISCAKHLSATSHPVTGVYMNLNSAVNI